MKLTSHKKQIIYDSIYTKVSKLVKVIETENIMVVTKDLGGEGSCYLMGIRFLICKRRKFLETYFTTKLIYLMLLNYILKNV